MDIPANAKYGIIRETSQRTDNLLSIKQLRKWWSSLLLTIPAQASAFMPPKSPNAGRGLLDATNYGYVCPLLEVRKPAGELKIPHRYWIMNEDCQNLNIWTPSCGNAKFPVMVWLHGGGFEAGSAIEHPAYEGENMCRNGQVVVVSINYRLNVLGYLDLSSFGEEYKDSGNAGTEDIVAALQWIKRISRGLAEIRKMLPCSGNQGAVGK